MLLQVVEAVHWVTTVGLNVTQCKLWPLIKTLVSFYNNYDFIDCSNNTFLNSKDAVTPGFHSYYIQQNTYICVLCNLRHDWKNESNWTNELNTSLTMNDSSVSIRQCLCGSVLQPSASPAIPTCSEQEVELIKNSEIEIRQLSQDILTHISRTTNMFPTDRSDLEKETRIAKSRNLRNFRIPMAWGGCGLLLLLLLTSTTNLPSSSTNVTISVCCDFICCLCSYTAISMVTVFTECYLLQMKTHGKASI